MSDYQHLVEPQKSTDKTSLVTIPLPVFVDDHWIASQIGMKASTIRVQRFNRKHGQPHWLDIDPVFIGSKPRWRLSDVQTWLENQGSQNIITGTHTSEVAQP